MSGDVAISAFTPRPAAQAIALPAAASAPPPADPVATAAVSKRPLVNPGLHLDVALNIAVLQFVDSNGDVTETIPSQKQLKAYQESQGDGNNAAPARPAALPAS